MTDLDEYFEALNIDNINYNFQVQFSSNKPTRDNYIDAVLLYNKLVDEFWNAVKLCQVLRVVRLYFLVGKAKRRVERRKKLYQP